MYKAKKEYRIDRVLKGDSWKPDASSPLAQPGLNIKEGDVILAVNGIPVDQQTSVHELLVNQSNKEVRLKILSEKKRK